MNDSTQNQNDNPMVRVMAIIGLIVMICVLAWLAVQVVRFIPSAFSSLASIFEANQRNYDEQVREDDDHDDNVIVIDDRTPSNETPVEPTPAPVAVEPTPATPVAQPTTPRPTTPAAPTQPAPVQYRPVVTARVPVSDSKGYTDLQVAFVAVGSITNQGRFVAESTLGRNQSSAMQFVVKNIGTKTSSEWSFVAELPNGSTMTSKVQAPLKPQESATLTVVFESGDRRGTYYVGATALGGNDISLVNNGFRTSVSVR